MEKNKKDGDLKLFNFKAYYNAVVIITSWYFNEDICINGIEMKSRNNPYNSGQLVFDKGDKTIQWGNKILSN